MRSRFLSLGLGVWAVGSLVILCRCVGDGDTTTNDGGSDATSDAANDVQPPDAGFTLTLAPGHLTEDPGDNVPITINVNRASGFNDPVSFVVTTPPGLTATQPAPAGSSSQFYIATNADAGGGDFEVTVTGSSTALVQNAKLGVHVGSLLAIGDGGAVTVPSFATVVDVKAWGAGGGAGNGCQFQGDAGGAGGPGGYAHASVPVQGGTYFAYVGAGGGYTSGDCQVAGGGGGYSGFFAPDGGPLVIAAGGGGGSSVYFASAEYGLGGPGGAGGGASGTNGGTTCPGSGGNQDGGGACLCGGGSPGDYLKGGNAASASGSAGGAPGGGTGGAHSGGGGGGYYGGAGGGDSTAFLPYSGGAGGGGAGYNPFNGGASITSDSGAPPSTNDPDYASNVGTAGFKIAGGPGRVVIRLPKP